MPLLFNMAETVAVDIGGKRSAVFSSNACSRHCGYLSSNCAKYSRTCWSLFCLRWVFSLVI